MLFSARTRRLAVLAVPLAVSAVHAMASTPTLDRIHDTGTIRLAYREDSVPFSYTDGGKPIGYSIDICSRVVDAIRTSLKRPELKVQYVPVTAANRMDTIASGKADLECGSTNNAPERREKVAFTIPHYITKGRMLVKASSGLQQWEDLHGKTVVAARGSSAADVMHKLNDAAGLGMRTVDTNDLKTAFSMLSTGKADAFAGDDVLLAGMRATSDNPTDYVVAGKTQLVSSYAMMMSKQDAEFKKLIDQSMTRLIVDGEVQKLYKKWFQQPIPPNNLNLQIPMSYLLRDSFHIPTDSAGN
ncbi:amino acid ABC transporter substrate-binding protein [Ralstonia solanacearum]|uniref:Amino acid ABC transporter substrate-binding protein n=1 Tax=Ralstonia solanacearum K60 TaxID=1091042 RepID=A0AAP8D3Z3_RALSL|nr:amino acid ABC transporter substrate-binding protein [Ralstonia solanacearum]MBT1536734.1 amino acid ABC transporter substrate-binding protein [Ralstonia solanacearum]OYQ13193.1 amino acid ABC transporter substrate-binding protein [Ralstonia solanacearum K60]QOK83550.1 amino acid ABC transporter substrate-binding protein [Ralstonia solanacearum]RIJ86957.1 amino acid ABC transporter substrate-binding protein [Ralstonia solanacearum]CCF98664.1 Amino-acid ABC transporter binding protein ybeJ [